MGRNRSRKKQNQYDKNGFKRLTENVNEKSFEPKKLEPLKFKNDRQEHQWKSMSRNAVTFVNGTFGTGKTFLAVRKAVEMLEGGKIKEIVLFRANVSADEDIGYLKGDEVEKVTPFLQCMIRPLKNMLSREVFDDYLQKEKIILGNIGTIRGIEFEKSFVLVDEYQNLTPNQLRLILGRVKDGSKVVLMGDEKQIDLHPSVPSAIHDMERFQRKVDYLKKNNKKGIDIINYLPEDVVRGKIARIINDCYGDDFGRTKHQSNHSNNEYKKEYHQDYFLKHREEFLKGDSDYEYH